MFVDACTVFCDGRRTVRPGRFWILLCAALLAAPAAICSCSDRRPARRAPDAGLAKRIDLPATTDPAVLAGAVRARSAGGCGDLAATLEALGARATGGRPLLRSRELRGLVDDALEAATPLCRGDAARARLASAQGPAVALARSELSGADQAAALASGEAAELYEEMREDVESEKAGNARHELRELLGMEEEN